jgi:hypothetical protein
MLPREAYSRKQTTDLETAMATALVAYLGGLSFPGPGGGPPIQLLQVFEEWAGFNDGDVPMAACVLPDGEIVYAPGQGTPTLLEDTWEPQGQAGWGLYRLSEATREFKVVARAPTGAERNAIKAGVETAFVDPQVLMRPSGARYGILLDLPDYFGLRARFTITSSRKLDDGTNAISNIQEAEFTIRAEAPHVVVGPVQPLVLRTTVTVGEGPIP